MTTSLHQIRSAIWKAVEGLSNDQINQTESTERWSIAQILEHLYQIEISITHKISQVLQAEQMSMPDEKPIQFTLNRSKKIKSPTQVNNEYQTLDVLKEKLETSRTAFHNLIKLMTPADRLQKTMPHPVFGEGMNLEQWIEFVALHEQRHLQQIEEVKTNLCFHRGGFE